MVHERYERRSLPARQVTIELTLKDGVLSRRFRLGEDGALRRGPADRIEALAGGFTDARGSVGLAALSAILARGSLPEIDRALSRSKLDAAGEMLFATLFGAGDAAWRPLLDTLYGTPNKTPSWEGVRVRIHTHDPLLLGLPWLGTTWRGLVLADHGWTFEVVTDPQVTPAITHTSPGTILVVAPELEEDGENPPGIHTADHIVALREIFDGIRPRWTESPHHFRVVSTVRELARAAEAVRPELLYYYGHGQLVDGQAHLCLGEQRGDTTLVRDLLHLAPALRDHPPRAVLLNACSMGQAGFHSAGFQLAPRVPLVIAHATVAHAGAARAFAIGWLTRWLRDGADPIAAAHRRPRTIGESPEVLASSAFLTEWATPIVFAHYGTWDTRVPAAGGAVTIEDAEQELDRDHQRAIFLKHVKDLTRHTTQRLEAVVAYGKPKSGTHLVA